MLSVNTRSGWNPGSTPVSRAKLASRRPALTTSTNARATSAATSALGARDADVAVGVVVFSASLDAGFDATIAGRVPKTRGVTSDTARTNATTWPSTATSARRGEAPGGTSVAASSTPQTAANNPSAPPATLRIRLSVTN